MKTDSPSKFWNNECQSLSPNVWHPVETSDAIYQKKSNNSWFTGICTMDLNTTDDQKSLCLNLAEKIIEHVPDVIKLETEEKIQKKIIKDARVEAARKKKEECLIEAESAQKKVKVDAEATVQKKKRKAPVKKEKVPMKTTKIRVYPSEEEKEILRKWFGSVRWIYNKCVDLVKSGQCKPNKKALRAEIGNNHHYEGEDNSLKWMLETPNNMRDEGIVDYMKAVDSNFEKKKLDPSHVFEIKFRSKKALQESVVVHHKFYKAKSGHFAFIKNMQTSSDKLPPLIFYDSRLVRTRLGEYYMCIPEPLDIKGENQAPVLKAGQSGVISLDPGVRTFMTGFDPAGYIYEFGKADIGRIYRLCHNLDKLISKYSKPEVRHRKRYRMKKAAMRMRKRIRNLVDDLHKKLAKWIAVNFRVVLLPSFETSQMVVRKGRKINNKTARAMLTWSHYKFKQHMIHMARKHPWCKLYIVDEAYTSKTCGVCGHIHSSLGRSDVFKCPSCGFHVGRDVNGARNILIRFLTTQKRGLRTALGL